MCRHPCNHPFTHLVSHLHPVVLSVFIHKVLCRAILLQKNKKKTNWMIISCSVRSQSTFREMCQSQITPPCHYVQRELLREQHRAFFDDVSPLGSFAVQGSCETQAGSSLQGLDPSEWFSLSTFLSYVCSSFFLHPNVFSSFCQALGSQQQKPE